MSPSMPGYGASSVIRVPFRTRYTTATASNLSSVLVLAPFNDTAGVHYTQAASGGVPDGTSTVGTTVVTDFLMRQALTPTATTAANVPSVRCVSFEVQVFATEALAAVGSMVRFHRWEEGAVAVVATGTPLDFFNAYQTVSASDRTQHVCAGRLVAPHTFRAAMRDRTGLEFTAVAIGTSPWTTVYGNTGGTAAIGVQPAFNPLVICWGGNTCPALEFVISGVYEIAPSATMWTLRIAKPLPSPTAQAEAAWWAFQTAVARSTMYPEGGGRSIAGVMGISDAPSRRGGGKAKSKPQPKKQESLAQMGASIKKMLGMNPNSAKGGGKGRKPGQRSGRRE